MKYFLISDDDPPISQRYPEYLFKSRLVSGRFFGTNAPTQELKVGDELYTLSDLDGSVRVYTVESPMKPDTSLAITVTMRNEPIKILRLRPKLEAQLNQCGIWTIGDLLDTSVVGLLQKPNLGRKSVNEINAALTSLGLPNLKHK